jgi:hypothetical protein
LRLERQLAVKSSRGSSGERRTQQGDRSFS